MTSGATPLTVLSLSYFENTHSALFLSMVSSPCSPVLRLSFLRHFLLQAKRWRCALLDVCGRSPPPLIRAHVKGDAKMALSWLIPLPLLPSDPSASFLLALLLPDRLISRHQEDTRILVLTLADQSQGCPAKAPGLRRQSPVGPRGVSKGSDILFPLSPLSGTKW